MIIDVRGSSVSGVISQRGFKACLGASVPVPLVSMAPADRIETSVLDPVFRSPNLAAIEGRAGHTLARHVGISDDALRARALRTHHDASAFADAVTAQDAVDEAFAENQGRIGSWMTRDRGGNLALHVHFDHAIGRVFRYDRERVEPSSDAEVVLERSSRVPDGYTVITAYPSEA